MCLTPGCECERSSSTPSNAPSPSVAADGLQTSFAALGTSGSVTAASADRLSATGVPAAAAARVPSTARLLNVFTGGSSCRGRKKLTYVDISTGLDWVSTIGPPGFRGVVADLLL